MGDSTPFKRGTAISQIIWDSLENTLEMNMQRLAKDIAASLGQPVAPLMAAIKELKVKPYIFDEGDEKEVDMRCKYICQPPSTPLFCQPCGRPVLWSATGAPRCAEHAYSRPVQYSLPVLEKIEYKDMEIFVGEDDTVYDIDYEVVGHLDRETSSVRLFAIDE